MKKLGVVKASDENTMSPATIAKHLVRKGDESNIVKQLTYGYTLSESVKDKMEDNPSRKKKRLINDVISSKLIRKYRMLAEATGEMRLLKTRSQKVKHRIQNQLGLDENVLKRPITALSQLVTAFFLRDDVSRPAAGKRETITRKRKRQKRYLTDTMINLRSKFLAENPGEFISYMSFTRLPPFFIVTPILGQRETTACQFHDNVQMMATKLVPIGILKTDNFRDLIESIVCNADEKDCMYRDCTECKGRIMDNFSELRSGITWKNSFLL